MIGIPFYVWDLAERFAADVIDDFVAEYAAGRTPNPCVRCNERIKFAAVLDRGAGARLRRRRDRPLRPARIEAGRPVLRRSVDLGKDQSYVLGTLQPEQLSRAIFPLGDITKERVRAEAHERGLLVADKPDSHDICFIADGDTAGFLRERLGAQPGPIVDDATGDVLGEHDGAYAFTVGQRRGLRLGRPAADGQPRYVLGIEPVSRTVRVGPAAALDVVGLSATDMTYTGPTVECEVQLRAHGAVLPATVESGIGRDGRRRARRAARGVAAGQAVVLYDGDRVLGGGRIVSTR